MTIEAPLTAAGVLVLAGFVQALTGFGPGLIAMGLLPLVLGLDQAQAVVALTSLATPAAMTGLTLRHVHWWRAGHLWLGSAIGVPLVFGILAALPHAPLVRMLGLAICLSVLLEFAAGRRNSYRLPDWAGWCAGLASGTLSGAFNIGGPPLGADIYGRPWPKDQQIAPPSGVFLTSGTIRDPTPTAHQRTIK